MKKILFLLGLIGASILVACGNMNHQKNEGTKVGTNKDLDSLQSYISEGEDYLQKRDFDGDRIYDRISFTYSGGVHCCYKMSLELSSRKDTLVYPFQMDGGYPLGVIDGSQPNQFKIHDYDEDGLPEIFMTISTYNGKQYAVDSVWSRTYGITTNRILFDYLAGEVVVSDF